MDFEINFYEDDKGNNPVEDFLSSLRKINNPLAEQVAKGLVKLKNRAYHREPLSKYLELGLWELRIKSGSNILRIIYTFSKGKNIILLHGFIKKQQKTPINELKLARKRLAYLKHKEES